MGVAELLKGRSEHECHHHFVTALRPPIKHPKTPWSTDETHTLMQLADKYGAIGWKELAQELGTHRTAAQCLKKYKKEAAKKKQPKLKWTDEDVQQLRDVVAKFVLPFSACASV